MKMRGIVTIAAFFQESPKTDRLAAAILDDLSLAEKRYRAAAGRAAFNIRRRRTLAAAYSLTDKAADGSIEVSSGSYEEYALALTRL